MRYVNFVLFLLMLVFIGVQYNDPDGLVWMVIYAVPAFWTAFAVFRQNRLGESIPNGLLLATIAAAVAGIIYYWPKSPRWWSSEVWYEVETAREGLGMMIVLIVLAVVWFSGRRKVAAR